MMGILKNNNIRTNTKKSVSFAKYNEVFIIPSRIDLFNNKEINKIKIGRFRVEREKKIKSRFKVEEIKA